jgi:hypothetical protein
MNTGYLIYQAERPRSPTEQRQVDIAHAELARSARRRWHALTGALRALRPAEHRSGRQPGHPARSQAARSQPAEYQAEGRPECLTGQHV